jgi:lipopolysaccharide biosynthesis regulator YciM
LLIALGAGVGIGRWAWRTRGDGKPFRSSTGKGHESFFKGVQYILSNDHDHAIEEFTKSVQVDSETVETYVALGNLYRSKGDIDRAIRIRQSIILRPHIDEEIRQRALFDLGLDYRKGGFLNRALKTFQEVLSENPSHLDALRAIERIYEELKDWDRAYQTRQKIGKLTKEDYKNILAHHLVEKGKVHQEAGEYNKAVSSFNKAIATHSECVDGYLHLGDLYFSREDYKKALMTWKKAVQAVPQFSFLVYRRLERAYSEMKNLKPVEEFLQDLAGSNSDAFTHLALARYRYNNGDMEGALREVANALDLAPHLWEARKLRGEILLSEGRDKEALKEYRKVIDHLHIPYLRFQCSHCGYEPTELQWQCPQCRKWDTIHLIDGAGTLLSAAESKKATSELSGSSLEE